jgi:hypothetical protein
MANQSYFSKLPKKQLVLISEQLIDKKFNTQVYNSYSYDKSYITLENVAGYFSLNVSDEDVEFFGKFIDINDGILSQIFETKDKSLYDQLIIPVAKEYKVEYSVWGSCTYTENYETTWTSYDKDWVTDSMRHARDEGNWDTYEGKEVDTSYDNYDMNDYEFDEVTEVDEVNESIKKNTIIESLDKKTLLELRGLIDKKLRSL